MDFEPTMTGGSAAGTDTDAIADTDTDTQGPGLFGLCWGVKPSFIAYVSRMPDGRAYLGQGVAVNAREELLFKLDAEATANATDAAPPDTAAPDGAADHVFAFRGEVLFRAHLGMLTVLLSRPRISLYDTAGELTVVDPDYDDGRRLRLVTFTVDGPAVIGGVRRWDAADVRLTAEGVPLFGDVYPASEPFAPLMITIPDVTADG